MSAGDRDTLTELPTTPGSLIEADYLTGAVPGNRDLWWLQTHHQWRSLKGSAVPGSYLSVVRVLFDAGRDA